MSTLFSPYALRSLKLPNRIVVSPMCQYVAKNGQANSWHLIHLGGLALSGAGLLFIEATAVEPDGRITPLLVRHPASARSGATCAMLRGLAAHILPTPCGGPSPKPL